MNPENSIFPAITLESTIEAFKTLPDRIMLHQHGIQIGYGEEVEDFFKIARETHWATGLWLDLYLLHKVDKLLAINVNIPPNCFYKPLAIRAKAFYDLALELYILAMSGKKALLNWIAEINLTPQVWMLMCEHYICEAGLRNSYFGEHTVFSEQKASRRVLGKTELYNLTRKHYSLFSETNLVSLKFLPSQKPLTWIQLLDCTGAAIAKDDSQFRNLHWQPYMATQLRVAREINNSKFLKGIKTNPDGSLEVLGRGNRGQDKGKRKGND